MSDTRFGDKSHCSIERPTPIPCHFCGKPAGYEDGKSEFWVGKGEGSEEWIKIAVPSNAEIFSLQLGPFGAMFICDDPKCTEAQTEFNNTPDVKFLSAFMFASMMSYVGGVKELDNSYFEREQKADEIMARHGGGASLVYDEYFHHDHKGEYVKEINERGLWKKGNGLKKEARSQ